MLRVYAFFHLNLMFSSVEEEARPTVIKNCYWPILDLAERLGKPIGIELTGYTLEEIQRIDPMWITIARRLMDRGLIELIGSGYAQVIGPLFPADLTEWNLKLGNAAYERLLGRRPTLALVNEQAYSAGILPHYAAAGYKAILMDWDMCAHAHPKWNDEWRYHAQIAKAGAIALPVLWTNTILFQKLQRLAHGDIDLDGYVDYVLSRVSAKDRMIALYSGDAEVFDFRPGRYKTEATASGESEWSRVTTALERLLERRELDWLSPSQAVEREPSADAFNALQLESAEFPIPVKKQMKYNVSRWAVTGRADFDINLRCRSLVHRLRSAGCADEVLWGRLCWLASSDFRTHITDRRFDAMLSELRHLESLVQDNSAAPAHRAPAGEKPLVERSERAITAKTSALSVTLNRRKGLAIESLHFRRHQNAIIGTIPHGTYDDLIHAFDWFSGTLIAEFVGQPKVTDLAVVAPEIIQDSAGGLVIHAKFSSSLGDIVKTITLPASEARIDIDYLLDWQDANRGTLRLGNITLLPGAVDPETLFFETHNGGREPERFALRGQNIDHGEPVSFLVSASSGVGMTEGSIVIGDKSAAIRIQAAEESNAFLGLITHRMIKNQVFCRVALSAAELDETRRPGVNSGPLRLGYSLLPA